MSPWPRTVAPPLRTRTGGAAAALAAVVVSGLAGAVALQASQLSAERRDAQRLREQVAYASIRSAALESSLQLRALRRAGRLPPATELALQQPLTSALRQLAEGAASDYLEVHAGLDRYLRGVRRAAGDGELLAPDAGYLVLHVSAPWAYARLSEAIDAPSLEADVDRELIRANYRATLERGGRIQGREFKDLAREHPGWTLDGVGRLDAGQVEPGDTPEMVLYALGEPARRENGPAGATTWFYGPDIGDPFWFPPHNGKAIRFIDGAVATIAE